MNLCSSMLRATHQLPLAPPPPNEPPPKPPNPPPPPPPPPKPPPPQDPPPYPAPPIHGPPRRRGPMAPPKSSLRINPNTGENRKTTKMSSHTMLDIGKE